VTPTGIEPVT